MGEIKARIVLTGGPKGGKTSVLESIKKFISDYYGYKVFVVSETATEVINGGIIPTSKPIDESDVIGMESFKRSNYAFQKIILNLQTVKETYYEYAASIDDSDSIIIYDRSIADNKGYLNLKFGNNDAYYEMLADIGRTEEEVMGYYDMILCLETSANIIDFKKQIEGDNTKRVESGRSDALAVDQALIEVYQVHPHYCRINATDNFEEKITQVLSCIRELLNKQHVKVITHEKRQ